MHNTAEFKGEKPTRIFTPEHLSIRIKDIVTSSIEVNKVVDICCGEFDLSKPYQAEVVGYDLIEPANDDHYFQQIDFLDEGFNEVEQSTDLIVCNPPFNGHPQRKLYPELFLKKILELYPDKPLAFITPLSLLFNQRENSARWRTIKDFNYSGQLVLPLDVFSTEDTKVQIHTQVLFFNIPDIDPIYFLED